MQNEYGICEGSILDTFIKSVAKNPNHGKYEELKLTYPLYFKEN